MMLTYLPPVRVVSKRISGPISLQLQMPHQQGSLEQSLQQVYVHYPAERQLQGYLEGRERLRAVHTTSRTYLLLLRLLTIRSKLDRP
ncbi:hypothetical protein TNCV_2213021 [Trichonephila clavipes]|nr:hypothetical protein TNCV_2213021 [Trichonephila clavipes]